jgi:hypothetical protein
MSESLVPAPVHSLAPRFDYEGLDHLAARAAQDAANRIRQRMQASIIETGRDLLKIKEVLDHGQFGRWLKAEFNLTDRTARNFMNAAELADAKSEIVSVLPAATLYRLASPSTPDIARDNIIGRLEKGETVTAKDVTDEIGRRRDEQAEADRLTKIPPKKLKRMQLSREQRERKLEADRLERERQAEAETEAARQAIGILRDRLDGDRFKEFAELIERSSYRFEDEMRKELKALCAVRPEGEPQ